MLVQNGDAHPIVPLESVKTKQIQVGSCGPYGPFKPPLSSSLSFSSFWCQPLIATLPKRFLKKNIFFCSSEFVSTIIGFNNKRWATTCCWAWADYRCWVFFRLKKQLRVSSMRIFFSRKSLEKDKTSTRNCSELLTVELPMENTHTHIG